MPFLITLHQWVSVANANAGAVNATPAGYYQIIIGPTYISRLGPFTYIVEEGAAAAVNFNNFDTIVAPDHDGIDGSNIITSRGSIHYLTLEEINKSRFYLEKNIEKNKDIITLILGGPNKYYNYSEENIKNILYRINDYIDKYNLQLIVIPSNRTPKKIINTIKILHNKINII